MGAKFSGGIIIPFAISLPDEWDLGTEVEADISNGITVNKYYVNFLASATLSHSLFKNFDFFTEGVVSRSNELKACEYFLDAGLVFALVPNVNIDTGAYYGLKSTSSKTYFLGLSFRL